MSQTIRIRFFTGLLALLLLLGWAPLVLAQEGKASLSVTPARFDDIRMKPGDAVSDVVKVTNLTDKDAVVTASVEDFQAVGEEGQQTFVNPDQNTTQYSMANWVKFAEKSATLKPGEKKSFSFTIDAPKDATPGGHYAALFFSTEPGTTTGGTSAVSLAGRIGALLLVTIEGDFREAGTIEEFSTKKTTYYPPVDFVTRFKNTGTVHVKPQGTIVIKSWTGKQVAQLAVNELGGNVLPGSIRRFESTWNGRIGFGKYTADLNMTYGKAGTVTATLSFWLFPWKEALVILIIVVGLILVFSRFRFAKKE